MSKRIGIGENYALAFGFTWQTIDPLESSGTQRKQLMAQGMVWEASFKTAQLEYIGASKEDFAPIKGVSTVAGAAQMAKHPRLAGQTVLIIMEQPVPDGGANEIAIVGLISGNIVLDEYTTTAHVKKYRVEYEEKVRRANKVYVVVGKSLTLGPVSDEFVWGDFRPTKTKGFGKQKGLAPVPVRPLEPKIPPKLIWGTVASLAVLGSVWFYMDYTAKEAARKAEAAKLAEKNSGPTKYSQAAADLLTQPVMPANTTFAVLRGALKSFPTIRKGWALESIKCTGDGVCTATWEDHLKLANFRDFVDDAPKEWGAIVLDSKKRTLSHLVPVKLPARQLPAQDKWPEMRTFLLRGFSQWQKYSVLDFSAELTTEKPVLMAVPPGVDPVAAASYVDAVWASPWTLSSTPWYLSEVFDKPSDPADATLPDSVTVDSITIKFEKNQSVFFEAGGQVYVRK